MNRFIRRLVLLALLFTAAVSSAQTAGVVGQIADAYNRFDYERCTQLLNTAFQSIDNYAPAEKVQIYQYAAFLAVHNGNPTLAANHFWSLLEIDPTVSLDPATASPKVLTLFQKTKIEYLEDLNRRLQVLQQEPEKDFAWRSFVFPGWEQWHRGYRWRGTIYAGMAAISLGGVVYSAVLAHNKKKDYETATRSDRITALYEEYDHHYRRQYYFGYAFAAVWLFSQADLVLWSPPAVAVKLGAGLNQGRPAVALNIHLK